jgi:hypothetical protein
VGTNSAQRLSGKDTQVDRAGAIRSIRIGDFGLGLGRSGRIRGATPDDGRGLADDEE